jgi:hypothetical protein
MKYIRLPSGLIECEHELCLDIHDSAHILGEMLPEDTFQDAVGWKLCLGCGHSIHKNGIHQACKGILAIRVVNRFGMIPGEHHKQYVIDQLLLTILGVDRYRAWLLEYNNAYNYGLDKPWNRGIAP